MFAVPPPPQRPTRGARLDRRYQFPEPRLLTVEFHAPECLCRACAPDRLDAVAIGKIACASAATTTLIAFAIDARGAAAALLAPFGVAL